MAETPRCGNPPSMLRVEKDNCLPSQAVRVSGVRRRPRIFDQLAYWRPRPREVSGPPIGLGLGTQPMTRLVPTQWRTRG